MVGMYIPDRISVTLTPSLDKRVFFLSTPGIAIKKGDYVMFTLKDRFINGNTPVKVIKKVGCGEGDNLEIKYAKHYYCNGMFLGIAKDKSKKGEPVKHFEFTGKIPEGKLFVVGTIPDSYDSKYFGFLGKEDVEKIAYPVL